MHDEGVLELMRVLRAQIEELVTAATPAEMRSMAIGLAHSLSRYKLKFSPDKVDTMIVQAIGLLDDLDKELNTYAMRLKEWYGWHFPEMAKVVPDNLMYAKAIRKMGVRTQCKAVDFSDILPEEVETEMKEAAEISMGTEVSAEDTENILMLCEQVPPPAGSLQHVPLVRGEPCLPTRAPGHGHRHLAPHAGLGALAKPSRPDCAHPHGPVPRWCAAYVWPLQGGGPLVKLANVRQRGSIAADLSPAARDGHLPDLPPGLRAGDLAVRVSRSAV